MPVSFNKAIVAGNLCRDVELKRTTSGTPVSEITVAVNERRKTASGQWEDSTTFVDVTLWGRTAEIADEYLRKGSPVLIEGRLQLDQWEQGGQKRSKLKVVGERMQMLGGNDSPPKPEPKKRQPVSVDGRDDADYDNPPF